MTHTLGIGPLADFETTSAGAQSQLRDRLFRDVGRQTSTGVQGGPDAVRTLFDANLNRYLELRTSAVTTCAVVDRYHEVLHDRSATTTTSAGLSLGAYARPVASLLRDYWFRCLWADEMEIRPRSGYSWQERLRELRRWRGDPAIGDEAQQVAPYAFTVAGGFAAFSALRAADHGVQLMPVIAPRPDGGAHLEWNLRAGITRHLEVAVPPERGWFSTLVTIESARGEILRATENHVATATDVLEAFERLLSAGARQRSRAQAR
jgi:hypothetical protein